MGVAEDVTLEVAVCPSHVDQVLLHADERHVEPLGARCSDPRQWGFELKSIACGQCGS